MNILITGASEGIGFEVAKILASENHTITLVARNKEKLEHAKSLLSGSGHQTIVADLSHKVDVDALKEKIDAKKYDVFINNAGVGMYGMFTEMPLHDQVQMMNLNITALTALSYFYLSQAKRGDALVNIASVLGISSYPGASVYAATKAYVKVFSESLWWEYKKKGVYVLAFCPGATHTNFHNASGGNTDNFPKAILAKPEDVARDLVTALKNRKSPSTISGFINRLMYVSQKFMSRKMIINMMGGFGPLKDRKE